MSCVKPDSEQHNSAMDGAQPERTNMKLNELNETMKEHNRKVAPGSECLEWGYFVDDCYERYQVTPWSDEAFDVEVDSWFAEYWCAIANSAF